VYLGSLGGWISGGLVEMDDMVDDIISATNAAVAVKEGAVGNNGHIFVILGVHNIFF
jgi:hypothetical protein